MFWLLVFGRKKILVRKKDTKEEREMKPGGRATENNKYDRLKQVLECLEDILFRRKILACVF